MDCARSSVAIVVLAEDNYAIVFLTTPRSTESGVQFGCM